MVPTSVECYKTSLPRSCRSLNTLLSCVGSYWSILWDFILGSYSEKKCLNWPCQRCNYAKGATISFVINMRSPLQFVPPTPSASFSCQALLGDWPGVCVCRLRWISRKKWNQHWPSIVCTLPPLKTRINITIATSSWGCPWYKHKKDKSRRQQRLCTCCTIITSSNMSGWSFFHVKL